MLHLWQIEGEKNMKVSKEKLMGGSISFVYLDVGLSDFISFKFLVFVCAEFYEWKTPLFCA